MVLSLYALVEAKFTENISLFLELASLALSFSGNNLVFLLCFKHLMQSLGIVLIACHTVILTLSYLVLMGNLCTCLQG